MLAPSLWSKADRLHRLLPRESARWKKLYRSRGGVERAFGRLKHEWAMLPLRCDGSSGSGCTWTRLDLGRLAVALAKARVVPSGGVDTGEHGLSALHS